MIEPRLQRASSRRAILRVFAERVASRGYGETTIADVADALGLSKGTIVHHFGSKEQLLLETHAAYLERRFAEVDVVLREIEDPLGRLAGMIYALLASHRDDRAATLAFLREYVRHAQGGLSDHVRERRREYQRVVISIIDEGVKRGLFVSSSPSLTALQIFGMCNYAWTWFRPDGPLSAEEITANFIRTVLGGVHSTTAAGAENTV